MKIAYFGSDHEVAILETTRENMGLLIDEAMRVQVRMDRLKLFMSKITTIDGEPDACAYAKEAIIMIVQAISSRDVTSQVNPDADVNETISEFKAELLGSYGMSLTQTETDTSLMFFEDEERFNACMRTAVVVNLLDATAEIFDEE